MAPTKRQQEILNFIRAYTGEHGYPPSYEEMSMHLGGLSLSTIHGHIQELVARGYLRRNGNGARALEVIPTEFRPYPSNVAMPTPENGFQIPPDARYLLLSCVPRLFAHWLVRGHPQLDRDPPED